MEETKRVKYDIIGLSETKRKEKLQATWADGSGVFIGARLTGSTSGGVGFIVAKHVLPQARSVRFLSHRIATLEVAVTKKRTALIVQVYAPTLDADDATHEDFYDELRDAIRSVPAYYKIVIGDFNARVGPRTGAEAFIGSESSETRNDSGERLASFCETNHLFHCNSFFKKSMDRRWTHAGPGGTHRHELDHILCNRRCFTEVGVVPSFNTGSDHRHLRANFHSSSHHEA